MSAQTPIEWADDTHNPWHGCTKISAGCRNCYAAALDARNLHGKVTHWGDHAPRRLASVSTELQPHLWQARWLEDRAKALLERRRPPPARRVFCGSMCDVAEDRPDLVARRAALVATIHICSWLRWLLLSKRPENFDRLFDWRASARPPLAPHLPAGAPPWVALGASVEDRDACRRVPALLDAEACWRFLSVEPLLESVRLPLERTCWTCEGTGYDGRGACFACTGTGIRKIDWVIVGGESGTRARPCCLTWIGEVVEQCREAHVPVFVKQTGSNAHEPSGRPVKVSGKGGDPSEWPVETCRSLGLLRADGSPVREVPRAWTVGTSAEESAGAG